MLDNTRLSGISVVKKLSLRSSVDVIESNDYVQNMLRALLILENDSRLSGLQTSDGNTAADLRVRVENFNDLYLSAILSRNLGTEDTLTKFYQADLGLKITLVNEKAIGVEEAIQSIQSVIGGEKTSVATGQGHSADRIQITGDAIGDIVALVNKSTLSSYLTTLYEANQELIAERAKLNLRLSKIKTDVTFESSFLTASEARLNALNENYLDLLVRAREMNRENNRNLSRALGTPHRAGSLIPKRGILIILLSVIGGGFIVVAAALVMPNTLKARA